MAIRAGPIICWKGILGKPIGLLEGLAKEGTASVRSRVRLTRRHPGIPLCKNRANACRVREALPTTRVCIIELAVLPPF
jgi:hypothetical protein